MKFTAKSVMAEPSAPSYVAEARLKRGGRYLCSNPSVVWEFERQTLQEAASLYVDVGRNCTTGCAVLLVVHLLTFSRLAALHSRL